MDTVKIDLMNHIFTKRGTRPMMPLFGTRIPEMLMEPIDAVTVDIIDQDIRSVVAYDPRVQLLDEDTSIKIMTRPELNAIIVAVELQYVELQRVDTLTLNLEFNN
jgi:phage baseplate assembly protein W